MHQCSKCGADVVEGKDYCPVCGYPYKPKMAKEVIKRRDGETSWEEVPTIPGIISGPLKELYRLLFPTASKKFAFLTSQRRQEIQNQILQLTEQNPNTSKDRLQKMWLQQNTGANIEEQMEVRKLLEEHFQQTEEVEQLQEQEEQEWEVFSEELEKQLQDIQAQPPEVMRKWVEGWNEQDTEAFTGGEPGTHIFPKGEGPEREVSTEPRGVTEEYWGRGDFLKKTNRMWSQILQRLGGIELNIEGWPPGYVAIPYFDRGVKAALLYNQLPMRIGKSVGTGYAAFMVPWDVDGQHWLKDFLKVTPRGEVMKIAKANAEKGMPGWLWLRRDSSQLRELFNYMLNALRPQEQVTAGVGIKKEPKKKPPRQKVPKLAPPKKKPPKKPSGEVKGQASPWVKTVLRPAAEELEDEEPLLDYLQRNPEDIPEVRDRLREGGETLQEIYEDLVSRNIYTASLHSAQAKEYTWPEWIGESAKEMWNATIPGRAMRYLADIYSKGTDLYQRLHSALSGMKDEESSEAIESALGHLEQSLGEVDKVLQQVQEKCVENLKKEGVKFQNVPYSAREQAGPRVPTEVPMFEAGGTYLWNTMHYNRAKTLVDKGRAQWMRNEEGEVTGVQLLE